MWERGPLPPPDQLGQLPGHWTMVWWWEQPLAPAVFLAHPLEGLDDVANMAGEALLDPENAVKVVRHGHALTGFHAWVGAGGAAPHFEHGLA